LFLHININFRNDFLENSRYAKIAFHVATTMETVNINEISNNQSLAHLVYNLLIKIPLKYNRYF
jgi:GAF domain-containing protein